MLQGYPWGCQCFAYREILHTIDYLHIEESAMLLKVSLNLEPLFNWLNLFNSMRSHLNKSPLKFLCFNEEQIQPQESPTRNAD